VTTQKCFASDPGLQSSKELTEQTLPDGCVSEQGSTALLEQKGERG